ncbi:hypothetical protein NP493_715g00013 [Ridgeia piscesae]|uniref:Uncharacterized protein n=1 Tax=Ridgeia piscesae TaxID=27915 RepID=A0AAD9KQZ2_RIDPI|nr:hypothetical protein NP493_715g00013 [Ridgeia piscesae]
MAVLINIISQIILKDGASQRINNENQNVTPRGNKIINRSQTPPKNQLSAQNHELTL